MKKIDTTPLCFDYLLRDDFSHRLFSFESALNKRYALANYQKNSFIMSLEKKDIYFTNLCRDNKGVINIVWFYKDGNYYLYDLLAISDEKIESRVIIEDD